MSRPHRLPVATCSGEHRYFLTICAHNRRDHFADAAVVAMALDQFLHTARIESIAILAYCFMPDHLHLVVQGRSEAADLRRFVRLAKQRSGYLFSQDRRQRLWQDSFFDRTLRRDEELASVVRYVIDNPVRAGLVASPAEYSFWGSQTHTREEILEFIRMS